MKNDKIRAPKLIFALPRLCKYLTGGIKCGRITGNSTKIWQVKMKKQDNTVSNNYEDYKARNEAAKALSDPKAPQFTLRNLLVFVHYVAMNPIRSFIPTIGDLERFARLASVEGTRLFGQRLFAAQDVRKRRRLYRYERRDSSGYSQGQSHYRYVP